MDSQDMNFGTKAIHAGCEPDVATGAIMTPIYQTSTYVQKSPGQHKGFEYSRTQNPTRKALEDNIAALENAVASANADAALLQAEVAALKAANDSLTENFNKFKSVLTSIDHLTDEVID